MELTMKEARALREILREMVISMNYDGSELSKGSIIKWNNNIKRLKENTQDKVENNPDNAPELWEKIL